MVSHGQTREERYQATLTRTKELPEAGFTVIEKWECEDNKTNETLPGKETKSYPHAIFYDFESWHDKQQRHEVTAALT